MLFREGNDDARKRIQVIHDILAEKEWKDKLEEGGRRVRESKSMDNLEEKSGFFTRRPSIPPKFVAEELQEVEVASEEEGDTTLVIEESPAVRTPISDRSSGTTTSIKRLSIDTDSVPPSPTSATDPNKPNPIYHRAKGNANGFFVNDVAMMTVAKKPPLPPRPIAASYLTTTPPSPSSSSGRKLSLAESDQYISHNSSEYSQESSRQGSSQQGALIGAGSVGMGKGNTWSKGGASVEEVASSVSLPLKLNGKAGI